MFCRDVLRANVFDFNVGGECWRVWMDFTAVGVFHMSLPRRLAVEATHSNLTRWRQHYWIFRQS